MNNVNIGELIHAEMVRQNRTVNWLAKEIYCEKSNVYKLFRRKSIDLAQVMRISEVLGHNFLRDCFTEEDED
jgi:predicted amino acid racemase